METLQKQVYQQFRGLNSWFTRDELNIERTIVLRFHSQGASDLLKIYLWAFFLRSFTSKPRNKAGKSAVAFAIQNSKKSKLNKMCLSEYVLVHSAN